MRTRQIALIHELQRAGDALDLPFWLESGWAVDARFGEITRDHDDIDLAIPSERMAGFKGLLRARNAGPIEETDYGFLVRVDGILLDCEACELVGGAYELHGMPPGSCPMPKQGAVGGVRVRCTSWQAIVWEYFQYLQEVPHAAWPAKDRESYAFVRTAVGEAQVDAWHRLFLARSD